MRAQAEPGLEPFHQFWTRAFVRFGSTPGFGPSSEVTELRKNTSAKGIGRAYARTHHYSGKKPIYLLLTE